MTSDFRFYLNRQGLRGQKGEKGDTGYSPSIVEEVNTLTDYRLKIINEFDEFVTDNLRDSNYFDVTDPNGTYLKYDNVSHRAYTGSLDQATGEAIGGAMLAQPEDIDTFNETKIVTPALFADSLSKLIVSPDGSVNITQNEETSLTEITVDDSGLEGLRAEVNRVKQDLSTEAQTRLNADNQQQVAIDAERREREAQDAALQNQISTLGDNFVNINGAQTITGIKTFSNRVNLGDSSYIKGLSDGSTIFVPSNNNGILQIGSRLIEGMETRLEGSKVTFNYVVPQVHKDNGDFKVLTQDSVEQGDNITIEQTTNGIKISSTASGGAIIDDTDPATDKVYSSSKTSDLIGELGDEVNSIAGRLNTLEGEVKVATTENLGLVQPDGTTITIDSYGKISAVGGGSGVAIDNDTIKQNTQGQIYVNKPNKDAQSYTMRTSSDGTEAVVQNIKMPVNQECAPSGEILYGQFVFEGQYGEQVDPLVSFRTLKEGNNIIINKNASTGELTIGCANTSDVSSSGNNNFTGNNEFRGEDKLRVGDGTNYAVLANYSDDVLPVTGSDIQTTEQLVVGTSYANTVLEGEDVYKRVWNTETGNMELSPVVDATMVDNQTVKFDNGVLKADFSEIGDEVNTLAGKVNTLEGEVAKKQNILTPSDGIKMQDVTVGAYPYTSTYQALVDTGQNLDLTSKISITDKQIDFVSEDNYSVFNFKFLGTTSSTAICHLLLSLGYRSEDTRANGYYLSFNGNGYIRGAFYNQSGSFYPEKSWSSLGITPGTDVRIELIYNHNDMSYRTIITNVSTNTVVHDYTYKGRNPGLTGGAFIYPYTSGGLKLNNYVRIPAAGIYLAESKDLRVEHRISAKVDSNTIEFNENGELRTTVDINALQARVDDLQLFKFPNATIEGDPTINNGQITDFSTTNYLRFPFEFKTEGRTWLLNGSFDTDSDITTQQNIIDSLASVALAVRNGRLVLALSTNGTSFNLGEHESMRGILANTKYYYRLSFSGLQYFLEISADKQEWGTEIMVISDQPIASKPMTISSPGHPFKGTINLNDYDLTVANTLVWQGMNDVGIASRMDVNASNITQTGIDKLKELLLGDVEALIDAINVNYESGSEPALAATPMMLALEPLELDTEDSFNTTIERATFDGDLDVTPTQFESVDYDDTDIDLGGNA